MFHVAYGLYFERQSDGSVRILKRVDGKPDSDIIMDVTVDPSTWGSIMASVCGPGENGDTFRRAELFHQFGRYERKPAICMTLDPVGG